jgi:hypothetical protein
MSSRIRAVASRSVPMLAGIASTALFRYGH